MRNEMLKLAAELREFALGLPGAQEEFPWGESVIKVNKKIFVFLGRSADIETNGVMGFSVKLPESSMEALELPGAEPTGYGLGKAGWVSLSFAEGACPPTELLQSWIVESYRAVAPKRLSAQLKPDTTDGSGSEPDLPPGGTSRKPRKTRNKPRP